MYYDRFRMRFTASMFTTEWQRLEVGVVAGCTISVILFVLVMEMILRACKCKGAETTTPPRSFLDEITALESEEKKLVKVSFVREGKETYIKDKTTRKVGTRWEGKWDIAVDLDTLLVFPLMATTQRSDLVMGSKDKKRAIIMELTVRPNKIDYVYRVKRLRP